MPTRLEDFEFIIGIEVGDIGLGAVEIKDKYKTREELREAYKKLLLELDLKAELRPYQKREGGGYARLMDLDFEIREEIRGEKTKAEPTKKAA